MNNKIRTMLTTIENNHQLNVLYACEAGSRSYGLANEYSDFDVRFIYIYPKEAYLCIDPVGTGEFPDVIEKQVNTSLDIHGWEFTKALRLFRKSNPSMLEWMNSSIVYSQDDFCINLLREHFSSIFNPKACMLHYMNMTKSTIHRYQNNTSPKAKNLLQIIRPVLAAKWIYHYHQFPPIHFTDLVKDCTTEELQKTCFALIEQKKSNSEMKIDTNSLWKFVNTELSQLETSVKEMHVVKKEVTRELNVLFRTMLRYAWE